MFLKGIEVKVILNKGQLVASLANETNLNYEVPRVIEVIACVFAKYLSSEILIFGRGLLTITNTRL